MFQFFTAKVGKLIETQVATELTGDKDPDGDKYPPEKYPPDKKPPIIKEPVGDKGEKVPVAFLELDVAGEQDSKPLVVSTIVQGIATNGKSIGQLVPFKDGVSAHLVFDIAFVRRLKPGTLLRVEWETRSNGIMNDVVAVARRQ